MKVLIITEGSESKGYGHITRCLSIYQAFEDKGISPRFIINGDNTVSSLLKNQNYEVFNWLKNAEKLIDIVKGSSIVIIDSYLADYSLYYKICNSAKLTVYIDDNNRINYPKGIVLNGSVYAQELGYPSSEGIEYLLGNQYIPLRKEFWKIPLKKINKDIKNIMVTFGGDDLRNLTPKIIKTLNEFTNLNSTIIIGKGFKNVALIKENINKRNKFVFNPDAKEMAHIMLESDIAISAAGQTLNELARIGTPTIAISVASNQVNHVNYWEKKGFIEYAGSWKDANLLDNILESINILKKEDLRQQKSEIGRNYFKDGIGSIKIVEYCLRKIMK